VTFLKSRAFLGIVGTILLFVVGALLIYGISTHSEPGMMDVTPEWDRSDFPLKVCARSYAESMPASLDAIEVVGDAVQVTNTRLGFMALINSNVCEDIEVVVGAPAEHGWTDPGGNATISPGHCVVQVVNDHGELRDLATQHELGHCLGLAHDDFEVSIMRRTQSPTRSGQIPPWITDSDRNLLRTNFGPR
jgi:hypothetical protein